MTGKTGFPGFPAGAAAAASEKIRYLPGKLRGLLKPDLKDPCDNILVKLGYQSGDPFNIALRVEYDDGIGPCLGLKGTFFETNLIKYLCNLGSSGVYELKTF